ncbi:class I SAM-dependent methyltransferase [Streptomyces sp. enrichment culture]|uniref:class I SAM-dependent methyltransferase n=1 Tax=Streptomyces sp. enrichment culture TaxID=1795815 RepID=UPI003F5779C8
MTTTMRQEEFLRRFHAERPGVTGEALARGAGPDGRSSYAMLGDLVRDARAVLDLGCGDGLLLERLAARHGRGPGGGGDGTGAAPGGRAGRLLAGVDLSAEALAAARGRAGVPAGAALAQARAQRLPFADGSFDACVSHMALMLMGEVDLVAAEVARVLRPGGVLACVVGGGAVPGGGDAYERFLPLLRDAVEAVPAGRRMPRLGDPRTRTREGLGEVLRGAGFGAVGWETVPLRLDGTADEVWAAVSGLYDLAALTGAEAAALCEAFRDRIAPLTGPDGRVPCAMRVHVAHAALPAGN